MPLRQKQIKHKSYPDLATLTTSGLVSPEVAYIVDQNAHYTRIAGVNTKVNPSSSNLTYTASATNGVVVSDNGTDATIPLVTTTNAGLAIPADKVKSDFITITQAVNLDTVETLATNAVVGNSAIVAGTNTKITYDSKGLVTSATSATASDIINVATGNIAATNVQTALNELDTEKQSISEKGVANGYASLDGTGKVPAAQLPSYVDDVLEFANLATFPVTGETGKLYTTLDTNKIYRWSGSAYVEVSAFSGVASDISFTATGNIAAVNVQTALVELDNEKQAKVQYQEEGASIGTLGGISTVNFTGIGTASVTGSTLTFNVPTVIASAVTNTPANTIAAVTVQAAIDELSLEKQEKIQLQEEGVNVGTAGQATTFNFVGSGITAAVSGTTATITVAATPTDNLVTLVPTGVNTIPNLVPAPISGAKTQISINGLIETSPGISVSNAGIFTVNSASLGYSIDTADIIICQYNS
jgi:hypothetical protein